MARPTKSEAIERLQRALDEISELKPVENGLSQGFEEFNKKYNEWRSNTDAAIAYTFGEKAVYTREFRKHTKISMTYREAYEKSLQSATSLLQSMIKEIEEYWGDEHQTLTSTTAQGNGRTNTNEVFIVHGRDNEAKETIARFLENLGLTPVILHEQPNQGRTIIEKFERHAQVGFAVALLTPDDVGELQDKRNDLKPRARQNVVFELGYFLGRLGRERVCALIKGNVEPPSDYDGVVYISLDDRGWKMDLIRELKNVGFDVDANRAL